MYWYAENDVELDDAIERGTIKGVDIRDAAFLWELGIRCDDDCLENERWLAEMVAKIKRREAEKRLGLA